MQNNSRRINNKTFITRANLIERKQELHEILRVHYEEKALSSSWKGLHRIKVVVWRLTSKHFTVRDMTRSLLGQKLHLSGDAHTCGYFLVFEAGTKTRSFDFAVLFIMLLWSRHLAAIRSIILESKGCNAYIFLKDISAKWKINGFVQVLNSSRRFHSLRR